MRPVVFLDAVQVAAGLDAWAFFDGWMLGAACSVVAILLVIAIVNRLSRSVR